MSINRKIKDRLMNLARKIRVKDVRIGPGYTAVLLENGQAGVAFTVLENVPRGCTLFQGFHPLAGKAASELLAFMDTGNNMETAVALATANAMTNTEREDLMEGDILEHLHVEPEDRIGMVGYFAPLVSRLKKKTGDLVIFEKVRREGEDLLSEEDAYRWLPQCQVVLITSTSIVNKTIDDLLNAAQRCREVVLLGASTPLIPELFSDTPITFLSGITITNPHEILRIVSEGGGVRYFKGHVKKVNLSLK